ncbi:MAG: putative hydroxymethylpyrimidine transport system permease protein, partial [Alphaproteobacteria bacterium]
MAEREKKKGFGFFSAKRRGWHVDAFWMLLSLLIILGLWEALVLVFQFPGHLLPRPLAVVYAIIEHWETIVTNSYDTILAVLAGYLLAVGFAVPV